MLNRSQQQHDDRGDNRERSTSAREAAEALFTLKPQLIEPSVREMASAGEGVRKPRVLAVTTPGPVQHDEPEAPINVKPPARSNAFSEHPDGGSGPSQWYLGKRNSPKSS